MAFIDVFAWIILVVILSVLVAVVATLGIMPGRIARQRGHPYAEAVAVGSWATLVFGLVFWPLVLIWAYAGGPEGREGRP